MKGKIKIYDDDDIFSIVDKLNDILSQCGITISDSDSGSEFVEFELTMHDQSGDDICE